MLRVPLPFRGVAVLLLTASTVVGQTPEPPAELPLESSAPGSPDFLRQYSSDLRHPLLQFMADGEFVSLDAESPRSPRLTPKPETKSTTPSTESSPPLSEVFADDIDCPEAPSFLPFACPPPPPLCNCRKCQRMRKHSHCGNYNPGYGNPYLGWPGGCPGCYGPSAYPYPGCGSHGCRHKHGCGYGYPGYGSPWGGGYGGGYGSPWGGYGGGYGTMGYNGFMDGACGGGCMPYLAPPPPPPPPCFCHKCQRKYGCGHHGGGYPGYGSPWGGGYGGYGGGYGGMGYGGFMDGCCGGWGPPQPPPPPPCHKCLRKHGYSYGYGYPGCGYPSWPAYPVPGANMVDGGYNGFMDPNCFGCGKHQHCHGLFHRLCGGHHTPPYPYYAYPRPMPCMMEAEPCCMDCGCGGDFCPALLPSGISE